MNILVVSGCSGDKQFDDPPVDCEELDTGDYTDLREEYPAFLAPAGEMYTGAEHSQVKRAVKNLREYVDVSWKIVSAGYGVLDESEEIVAYDCSLSDIEPVRERVERMGYDSSDFTIDQTRLVLGQEKDMHSDLRDELLNGYDLVFVVLSEPYLAAVSEALTAIPDGVSVVAFASAGSKSHLGDANWVPATNEVRDALGTTWFRLRGQLLHDISTRVDASLLEEVAQEPETLVDTSPYVDSVATKR